MLQRAAQLVERSRHLAAGDPHPGGCSRSIRMPVQVVARQRLLDPQHPVLRAARSITARAACGPRPGAMSPGIRHHWLRSTMISSASPTAARIAATTATPSSIRSRAIRILSAWKPSSTSPCASSARCAGVTQFAERGVDRQAIHGATEQRRHRVTARLPDQVPQRRLERPVAAGVKRDRLQRACVGGQRQRVAIDEQMLERLKAVHRVAAADPGEALVGLHAHDRGVEPGPRLRVPGGVEGGIKRQAEPLYPYGGDLHEPP